MRVALISGIVAGATLVPAVSAQLQTVTINFDDQPGGIAPPALTDGLFSPHATFSTADDSVLLIFAGAGFVGGSAPNVLTAALSQTAADFDSDIYIDFTVAANNVSLLVVADNDVGFIGSLMVTHHAGGISQLDLFGNGDITDGIPLDLSQFRDVTRIQLVTIADEFGLAIDNLVFDVPVPAPGALAVLGVAAAAGVRRGRRS